MKPIHISGSLWHQPNKDEVKSFVYTTGDKEGRGGRILFWLEGEVSVEDIEQLSTYLGYL